MADKKKTVVPAKGAKPAPKPSKPVKPAPKPAPKPTKPAPKPAAKPAPKQVQKQPVKPAKPAPKPAVKPAPKPAPKPVAKPAPKPEPKQAVKPVAAPKPAPAPVTKPAPAPKPAAAPAPKAEKKGVKVGDMAPDFNLKNQFGHDVKLSDLKGKKVLLSFHPLAWTPICEMQMRTLEMKKQEFDKLNTVPLGISVDSMYSKREWANFIEIDQVQILADFWPHGEMAKKYGQFIDKGGVSGRVNILIDETGKIIWMKVYQIPQIPDIEEVLTVLAEKSAKKK